jgi:hypothetical protein
VYIAKTKTDQNNERRETIPPAPYKLGLWIKSAVNLKRDDRALRRQNGKEIICGLESPRV